MKFITRIKRDVPAEALNSKIWDIVSYEEFEDLEGFTPCDIKKKTVFDVLLVINDLNKMYMKDLQKYRSWTNQVRNKCIGKDLDSVKYKDILPEKLWKTIIIHTKLGCYDSKSANCVIKAVHREAMGRQDLIEQNETWINIIICRCKIYMTGVKIKELKKRQIEIFKNYKRDW